MTQLCRLQIGPGDRNGRPHTCLIASTSEIAKHAVEADSWVRCSKGFQSGDKDAPSRHTLRTLAELKKKVDCVTLMEFGGLERSIPLAVMWRRLSGEPLQEIINWLVNHQSHRQANIRLSALVDEYFSWDGVMLEQLRSLGQVEDLSELLFKSG